jgi:hypothetical protein
MPDEGARGVAGGWPSCMIDLEEDEPARLYLVDALRRH